MHFVKSIINFILNIVFPPKCVFCGKHIEPYSEHDRVDGHSAYCAECADEIHFCRDYNCCIRCGKPSAVLNKHGFCKRCTMHALDLHTYRIISVLFYEGVVKSSILRYKLSGKKHYSKSYVHLMCDEIEHEFNHIGFDLVTSAPSTKDRRKRNNGFDHAEVLGRKIAKRLNIKYKTCLTKLS